MFTCVKTMMMMMVVVVVVMVMSGKRKINCYCDMELRSYSHTDEV